MPAKNLLSRRRVLQSAAAFALTGGSAFAAPRRDQALRQDELLEEMSSRGCLYFLEQAHPETGLVLDRANADGTGARTMASIAATGFGLSALCIADARRYVGAGEAEIRVRKTLNSSPTLHRNIRASSSIS